MSGEKNLNDTAEVEKYFDEEINQILENVKIGKSNKNIKPESLKYVNSFKAKLFQNEVPSEDKE